MSFMGNNNGSVGDLFSAGGGMPGVAKSLVGGLYGGMQAVDDNKQGFYMPQFSWKGNGLADQKFSYVPFPKKQRKWGSLGDAFMSGVKNLNSNQQSQQLGTIGQSVYDNILGQSGDLGLGTIGNSVATSVNPNIFTNITGSSTPMFNGLNTSGFSGIGDSIINSLGTSGLGLLAI